MRFDNPDEHSQLWLLIIGIYAFLMSFIVKSPLTFDLNEGIQDTKNDELIIEGSQSSYLTKVSKNLKTVNDYTDDFILLCCYILRTRTERDIQELMKQILCTFENSEIVSKSVDLSDDIYCDLDIKYDSSVNKSKQEINAAHIKFSLFGDKFSKNDMMDFFQEIREHYTGTIGNARSDLISEMYTHLYNEPCLVDEDQLNRINKTPKDILDCYHRHPENPEGFVRGLLRNK